jgi:hypothetical protein
VENKINKDKNIRAREVDGEVSDCDGDAVTCITNATQLRTPHNTDGIPVSANGQAIEESQLRVWDM